MNLDICDGSLEAGNKFAQELMAAGQGVSGQAFSHSANVAQRNNDTSRGR
ncbi:MAG: hypothetical protein IT567_01745 [Alphaproteobacteria bacterium]|nr:hypothetical protein [Alphaproteobacteria bacterium]